MRIKEDVWVGFVVLVIVEDGLVATSCMCCTPLGERRTPWMNGVRPG
jgi:hypothetical protein